MEKLPFVHAMATYQAPSGLWLPCSVVESIRLSDDQITVLCARCGGKVVRIAE